MTWCKAQADHACVEPHTLGFACPSSVSRLKIATASENALESMFVVTGLQSAASVCQGSVGDWVDTQQQPA